MWNAEEWLLAEIKHLIKYTNRDHYHPRADVQKGMDDAFATMRDKLITIVHIYNANKESTNND